jgi:VWFA-related protein
MPLRRAFALALILPPALMFSAAPPLVAQDAGFAEAVDVNVVNVDVYVTDRQGKPVPGLTAADFQIQEDGKKMKVEYFAAFGEAAGGGSGAAAPVAGGGAGAGSEAAPGEPLHIVLFVDNANLQPQNRNRALAEMQPFLERWAQEEGKVMIITFDGHAEVQQHFTDDPALIRANLEVLAQSTGQGFQRSAQRAQALASVQSVLRFLTEGSQTGEDFARSELQGLMRQVEFFSESSYQDVVRTLEVMKGVVRTMGVLSGRKMMIHLSDGLPMRPGEDLIFALQDAFADGNRAGSLSGPDNPTGESREEDTQNLSRGETGVRRDPLTYEISRMRSDLARFDTSRFFGELVALANANRVTFYPVNGAGGEVAALGADSRSDLGFGGSMQGMLSVNQASLRESLQMMAGETGGQALLGGSNVDGLMAKVETDLDAYYSLGFTPAKITEEEIRKLKLKVKGRGLELRYRESYLARPGGNRISDRVIGALFLDVDENPLGVQVEVAEQQPDPEGDGSVVVLLAKIPIGALTLTPQQGYHEAKLELHVATMDPDGRSSPVRSVPLSIKVPEEQLEAARTQFYGAQLPLRMRAGEARVAVGVWDAVTRSTSIVSTPVVVGES